MAVTAAGMPVVRDTGIRGGSTVGQRLFQQPLVSTVNVPSRNVVPTGNTNGTGNNAGQGNVGGAGNTVGGGNAGGGHR